jgi:hypothetical protein
MTRRWQPKPNQREVAKGGFHEMEEVKVLYKMFWSHGVGGIFEDCNIRPIQGAKQRDLFSLPSPSEGTNNTADHDSCFSLPIAYNLFLAACSTYNALRHP